MNPNDLLGRQTPHEVPSASILPAQTVAAVPTRLAGLRVAILGLGLLLPSAWAAEQPANPAHEEQAVAFRAPWNGEMLGTGARRPTATQWAWGEENLVRTRDVKLNRLGLERVNAHRRGFGQRPLEHTEIEVVATGAEAIGAKATTGTSGGTVALASVTLPTGVDNSLLKYFPPIRSQGSLGSCAQFAAVYYTLTHMTALARNWDAKGGGDTLRFSPKWTYNMVNGGENVGSWHYDAYAIAQKHGLATWADFPYDADYRGWCLNPNGWWNALGTRADLTGRIPALNTDTGLSQVKQLLVNGYVLNFATYIYSWVWTTVANDPSTTADDALVGKPCVAMVNGTSGGHCMTIVGYNDDLWVDLNANGIVDAGEKGALRIANSWGTGWNEAGYCWISYQALRTRNAASTSEGLAWYDEATWVTARASYTPKLVAQFTLNHLKRNQLNVTLGTSASTQSKPAAIWTPNRVLAYAGGAWAFNGTATACDGTFYLDFTDLVPATAGTTRYYLGMYDSTAGDVATLDGFTLVDLVHGKQVVFPTVPQTADAAQDYVYVDYDFSNGAQAPVAAATVSTTGGNLPLTVTFDASASSDADGQIVAYAWNFGDGATGTGVTVQHIYTQAGAFAATLTVTDDLGLQSSANTVITVTDPNVLNAPSGLGIAVSGRIVTLRWTDKSGNETGFYVERGLKNKNTIAYTRVATVGANSTVFTESVAANTYYYRVQAFSSVTGKVSGYSNEVSVRVR
jgi:C1A family cysteine protease/PKD repeat protein